MRVEIAWVVMSSMTSGDLWGCNIDFPQSGAQLEANQLAINGWVLGRHRRVVAVEILYHATVLQRCAPNSQRPDVAAVYPDVPYAALSGFQTRLSLRGMPEQIEFQVQAVLEDRRRVPIADLRIHVLKGTGFGSKAIILLYHRVADLASDPWALAVSPRHFAEHLEVLRQYQPLRLSDMAYSLRDGRPLPHRSVVVTFDDGYADNLANAKPLLDRHAIPATVFLTSAGLGHAREFWWDELQQMLLEPGTLPTTLRLRLNTYAFQWELGEAAHYSEAAYRQYRPWRAWEDSPTSRHALYVSLWERLQALSDVERDQVLDQLRAWASATPRYRDTHRLLTLREVSAWVEGSLVDIGGHTLTHPRLATLPVAVQSDTILRNKVQLEAMFQRPVTLFAYPYGKHGDYTAESVRLVQDAGFDCACSNFAGFVSQSTDRFQLPRLYVQDWSGDEFAQQLAGLLSA